ncbi:DUF6968 family protein [Nonomuraea sp. CA-218870]|uniref:DUF2283 domain-containing protein n=1 Tax=Nonomuraea corallina TaxID=2989783 RepID=A0ABT4SL19_9ACTN|nr:DUF2283 domain-containing protein [Nonomuraea corallina]MDA0637918.1 DUF2283 domain-containing protein [Nonomuraea corallina]
MYEIARRTLTLRTEPPREVIAAIGMPYVEPEGDWSCPYRIDGLAGWDHERKATGTDSLQAVELAMGMVRAALAGSHEAKEGLLAGEEDEGGGRPCTVYTRWDRYHNVAYISMKHEILAGEAARQVVAGEVVLEFGGGGELLGVELTDAETLMPAEMRL